MNQTTIDWDKLHRSSDPQTSRDAARGINQRLAGIRRKVFEVACDHWSQMPGDGLTARELAEICVSRYGGEVETFRKRVGELESLGVFAASRPRPCRYTGTKARTFVRALK